MGFEQLNALGKNNVPFLFITDFLAKNVEVYPLDELKKHDIEFCIDEQFCYKAHTHTLAKKPITFAEYERKFDKVIEQIKAGNTYVLNLTQPTHVQTFLKLEELYKLANAHYKLRYKEKFVCFSPEKFIQIDDDTLSTFPMKGTIDASVPNAQEKILANAKEMAEHIMVVDLLRNDLGIVASNVRVEQLRYVQKIAAGEKELLQVSSKITAKLPENWRENIGDILQKLLPAGSICGTPKKSTVEIIQKIEGYERGFFSGVFGVFDGKSLDSGVMIRFIEKTADGYIYKSGGGITLESNAMDEYQEMIDKIYLP